MLDNEWYCLWLVVKIAHCSARYLAHLHCPALPGSSIHRWEPVQSFCSLEESKVNWKNHPRNQGIWWLNRAEGFSLCFLLDTWPLWGCFELGITWTVVVKRDHLWNPGPYQRATWSHWPLRSPPSLSFPLWLFPRPLPPSCALLCLPIPLQPSLPLSDRGLYSILLFVAGSISSTHSSSHEPHYQALTDLGHASDDGYSDLTQYREPETVQLRQTETSK